MAANPASPLAVGQRGTVWKTITAADIEAFAALTGDRNPLHLDDAFARQSRFGRPVAHGVLVAGVTVSYTHLTLPTICSV